MNKEEFERHMAFMVEQQARLAVGFEEWREAHKETESIVARLAYATLHGFKDVNAKIDAMIDGQIRLQDIQARTEACIQRTESSIERTHANIEASIARTEASIDRTQANIEANFARTEANIAKTDATLRRFIEKVDRIIGERHTEK